MVLPPVSPLARATASEQSRTLSSKGAKRWLERWSSSLMMSIPPKASAYARSAKSFALLPMGFSAVMTRGRPFGAPQSSRRPSGPKRGPGKSAW